MIGELEVLHIVGERLDTSGVPYMLTGSFALAYYTTPRMTRDIDLVVELGERDVGTIVKTFAADFYIDADDVRSAVLSQRLFNLMHLASGIKVDLIVRKESDYRRVEFARRQVVNMAGVQTWIVSREDLILSKLIWAEESGSELQRRDVRSLLDGSIDREYLEQSGRKTGTHCITVARTHMNDTSPKVAALVAERHQKMSPDERMRIAAEMFETARAIVESSLPPTLTRRERRLALVQRLYAGELPQAALIAFAEWPVDR